MTDPSAYSLEFWVGQEVFAVIPAWSRELIPVTICGVEAGGVWIEAEGLTIGFCRGKAERDELDDIGRASAFVPYAQIGYIIFVMPKETQRPRVLQFGAQDARTDAPKNDTVPRSSR
jgi:hypothetical protein